MGSTPPKRMQEGIPSYRAYGLGQLEISTETKFYHNQVPFGKYYKYGELNPK